MAEIIVGTRETPTTIEIIMLTKTPTNIVLILHTSNFLFYGQASKLFQSLLFLGSLTLPIITGNANRLALDFLGVPFDPHSS
jgi:hypothetical protein